jgi:hypothetical protein
MILPLRPAQQVKFDKAGNIAQVTVARCPYAFELSFGARKDFEAIHCDEHLEASFTVVYRLNVTTTPVATS